MSAYTIIENIKKTIELLSVPVASVCAIWGFDIATYVAATATVLIAILSYVEIFLDKPKEE